MVRGGSRRGSGGAAPLVKDPARYKTELCSTWMRSGGCPYGHKCQFAHGVDELRARQDQPSSYKTKVCRSFSRTGRCPYGVRCRFVHGDVVEAQQLAMMRLMEEAPLLPGQAAHGEVLSPLADAQCQACPSTSQLAPPHKTPQAFGQLPMPSSRPLGVPVHAGVLSPSAQVNVPLQPQFNKLTPPLEDARTSYASSFTSSQFSSRYTSPQLMPQPWQAAARPTATPHLHTPQQTPPHTPLLAGVAPPGWPEHSLDFAHGMTLPHPLHLAAAPPQPNSAALSPPALTPAVTPPTYLSPIASPTGGLLPAPFALPAAFSLPPPAPASGAGWQRLEDSRRQPEASEAAKGVALLDDGRKGAAAPPGESLIGGDELGLQYAQSLAEQLAEMCMSPQPDLSAAT